MFLGWMEEVAGDVKSPLTQSGYDVAEVWEKHHAGSSTCFLGILL